MKHWTAGYSAYGRANLAGPFNPLIPFSFSQPRFDCHPANDALPDDLPDYLVFVTRNALQATTSTLTKTSTEVHNFFFAINQAFACERMMRSMASWYMPGFTPSAFTAASPWATPPKPQPAIAAFWGTNAQPALPMPRTAAVVPTRPAANKTAPAVGDCATAMAAATGALLGFGPAVFNAWRAAL